MQIAVSKSDVIWGYAAKFFSLATGVIVLPVVLRMLSTEEIAMNYLMLTVSSLVALFDFGFAPQFGRNITYVFAGAQELRPHGIAVESRGNAINYQLLAGVIETAKFIYRRLSFFSLAAMLSAGTYYIGEVTNGFTNVTNALLIWVTFSISTFFNVYYTYCGSLLTGRGMIREAQKAAVYSRCVYLAIAFATLFAGWGLLGLVLANLITPFVSRYLSLKWFYTHDLRERFKEIKISRNEKTKLVKIIWPNAWRFGLMMIGAYAVNRMGIFLSGVYLPAEEIASYGLMIQLVGVIYGVAGTLFTVCAPRLSSLRVSGDKEALIREFSFQMNVGYFIFIIASIVMILFGNNVLSFIGANARLPSVPVMIVFSITMFLEFNHGTFASFITTGNQVPFVFQSITCGIAIIILEYCSLRFTTLGIFGVILAQGFVQLVWPNWYWPRWVFKEFKTNVFTFTLGGFCETIRHGNDFLQAFFRKIKNQ